ncbi:hypothetical protein [Nitratireductor mangrovi]|uniref:hypothetical protein n=1 Tax=Nitratireductor mangrovi TaxID=2599600 RepID=UPI0019802F62|nr:hypothetical protein [Nitratireductor mangrovi]
MNALPKYVASRTLEKARWHNTLGRGIRLFPDGLATTLSLAECRPFGDGIVLLRYLSRPR